MHYTLLMEPIAHIQTDFAQKFGIHRQSGIVAQLEGRIVFAPVYAVPDAVRGLDEFSHIWLLWEFERESTHAWQPLVRPPRLGGDKKMGVFATRSPNRPNRIALSCVRLLRVALEDARDVYGPQSPIESPVPVLYVGGADLRDNTPIYDIKPYLPEFDAHPDATGGFTDSNPWHKLPVNIAPELLARIPEAKREALLGVLAEDPRPARMHTHKDTAEYKLTFAQKEIRFTVSGSADSSVIHVTAVD